MCSLLPLGMHSSSMGMQTCVFKEACQNYFVKKGVKSPSPSDRPKFSVLIIFILLVTEGTPL